MDLAARRRRQLCVNWLALHTHRPRTRWKRCRPVGCEQCRRTLLLTFLVVEAVRKLVVVVFVIMKSHVGRNSSESRQGFRMPLSHTRLMRTRNFHFPPPAAVRFGPGGVRSEAKRQAHHQQSRPHGNNNHISYCGGVTPRAWSFVAFKRGLFGTYKSSSSSAHITEFAIVWRDVGLVQRTIHTTTILRVLAPHRYK